MQWVPSAMKINILVVHFSIIAFPFDFYKTRSHTTETRLYQDIGIADQQKAGKQGRDDSIKLFGMQLLPIYIFLH